MKEFLENNLLCSEELMPYELMGTFGFNADDASEEKIAKAFNEKRGRQARMLEDRAIYKVKDVTVRGANEIDAEWIKKTIREGRPVVALFMIDGTHWTQAGQNAGIILDNEMVGPDGKKAAAAEGSGHTILIVGYRMIKDPKHPEKPMTLLIIRNSWGLQWGDQGYGYLAWETYAKDRLAAVMTIGAVETVQKQRLDQAPQLDLRVQGIKNADGSYGVGLSTVVKSNYLPEGGIKEVEYAIFYTDVAKPDKFDENTPTAVTRSSDPEYGFAVWEDKLSESSIHVRLTVRYKEGGMTKLYFPIPETVTWSPRPDVKLPDVSP